MNYQQFNNKVLDFYLHRNQSSFCYLGISEEEFTSITKLDSVLGFSEIREPWSRLLSHPSGIPQYFGLLAIQCLAATLMEKEGSVNSSAYQIRFLRLTGFNSSAELQRFFNKVVNGSSVQETIWNAAQEYLITRTFKTLIIPPRKTNRGRYVQFPLSQVLLNKEDLKSFHFFFSKHYIPGENIGLEDFSERLKSAFRDNSVCRRAISILLDEERKDAAVRQIFTYFLSWDGSIYSQKGKSNIKNPEESYQSLILSFENEKPEFFQFPSMAAIEPTVLWEASGFHQFHPHLKIFNSLEYYKNEFEEQRLIIHGKASWILLNRLYWKSVYDYARSHCLKEVEISEYFYLFYLDPGCQAAFFPLRKLFASQVPIVLKGGLKVGRGNCYIEGFGPNIIANDQFVVLFNGSPCQYGGEYAKTGQYRIQTENFRDITFSIIPVVEIFSIVPSRELGWDLTVMSVNNNGSLEGAAIDIITEEATLQIWRRLQVATKNKKGQSYRNKLLQVLSNHNGKVS